MTKGGERVSDKEKDLAARIAAMPPKLQDKFLEQARGAELALEVLGEKKDGEKEDEGK